MFENKVLRRKFGPKGEEVAGGWRRLHNEFHEMLLGCEVHKKMFFLKREGKRSLADLSVDKEVILEWILEE
jgi:hypothetical protein